MSTVHRHNFFNTAQSLLTGSGVTLAVASTSVLDLQAADYGEGHPIDLVVELSAVIVGGVAPTLTIRLDSDIVAGMGTFRTEIQTRAYSGTELTRRGLVIKVGLPSPIRRFVRLHYTLVPGAAAITAGAITAYLAHREVVNG